MEFGESSLIQAINIAYEAHKNQIDKGGHPYFLHPLRVMLKCEKIEQKVVALLHDVIEDSGMTMRQLQKLGFDPSIVDAIDCLTKKKDEDYTSYIVRISTNKIARHVKIRDLQDNMDLTRLATLTENDFARMQKYHKALSFLLSVVD